MFRGRRRGWLLGCWSDGYPEGNDGKLRQGDPLGPCLGLVGIMNHALGIDPFINAGPNRKDIPEQQQE